MSLSGLPQSRFSQSTCATDLSVGSDVAGEGSEQQDLRTPDTPQSAGLPFPPVSDAGNAPNVKELAGQLFSEQHFKHILSTPHLLRRFTSFLSNRRPQSLAVLVYYLDVLKALQAICYANAISAALELPTTESFTAPRPRTILGKDLEDKAQLAFSRLLEEDVPAYITQVYVNAAMRSITHKITGNRAGSGSSKEVPEAFVLIDALSLATPIVFASKGFHEMTQYTPEACFGPETGFINETHTPTSSLCRLEEACQEGKEHCELVLQYRHDGTPYLSLLTLAPLCDSRGKIRYYLGSQVEIDPLDCEGQDIHPFDRPLHEDQEDASDSNQNTPERDEFKELCKMLNPSELQTAKRWGGRMHSERQHATTRNNGAISLQEPSAPRMGKSLPRTLAPPCPFNKPTCGPYKEYLLLRPFPSLRILFASPTLRVPGILQCPFLARISASRRVHEGLSGALAGGRRAVAKVRWTARPEDEPRTRWIQCTPLRGQSGHVGAWIVVLVEDSNRHMSAGRRRERGAGVATKSSAHGYVPVSHVSRHGTAPSPSTPVRSWCEEPPTRRRVVSTSRKDQQQQPPKRPNEWCHGTYWRPDDDESEDEQLAADDDIFRPLEQPSFWADATAFLSYGSDDETGEKGSTSS